MNQSIESNDWFDWLIDSFFTVRYGSRDELKLISQHTDIDIIARLTCSATNKPDVNIIAWLKMCHDVCVLFIFRFGKLVVLLRYWSRWKKKRNRTTYANWKARTAIILFGNPRKTRRNKYKYNSVLNSYSTLDVFSHNGTGKRRYTSANHHQHQTKKYHPIALVVHSFHHYTSRLQNLLLLQPSWKIPYHLILPYLLSFIYNNSLPYNNIIS